MPTPDLDAFDRTILATLQENARLTNVELADRVGLSPSPCLRRTKRLEQEGLIEAYRSILKRERIGLNLTVFLEVQIHDHANVEAEAFQDFVLSIPEVIAFHLISGEADYLMEVVVPDVESYQRFLTEKLLSLPIVKKVRSHIALQVLRSGQALPLNHLAIS